MVVCPEVKVVVGCDVTRIVVGSVIEVVVGLLVVAGCVDVVCDSVMKQKIKFEFFWVSFFILVTMATLKGRFRINGTFPTHNIAPY